MTGKKSAVPLAIRILFCLALLAPFAGQAGADQISIYSWTGWQQSTQVNYDDAVPWGGVSSLPAPETFTLPTQAYTGPYLESVPSPNTPLNAGPGVTYYRALFDMPDFGDLAADLLVSVDNDVEVYINRQLVAREGSLSEENFRAPPLSVSLNGSGEVLNGNYGYQQFDWAAPTFPRTNWIRSGINEVIVVVRNLSYESGGFSFAMNITAYPPNQPPTLTYGESATFRVTTGKNLPVAANIGGVWIDPERELLTVTSATQGVNGSVAIVNDGSHGYSSDGYHNYSSFGFRYTPRHGFTGEDSFTYTVSDGRDGTAIGTVVVDVVETQPRGNPDFTTTDEDTPVTLRVTANDSDPSGDSLYVTAVTQGANGSVALQADGRVTYTPNPNFSGRDAFIYRMTDGFSSDTNYDVWVTVTVDPVNDPPTAVPILAQVTFGGTATVDVVANDLDVDGDPLTVTAVTQPAFGRAEIADNKVVYTNIASSQSTSGDSLSYTVSDGQGGTATGTLKLKFTAHVPALSVPGPLTVKAGLPLRFTVKALDPNSSPPATLSTQVVSRTLPAGASFRNDTLSWTPQSDQVGTYKLVFGARTNTSPSLLLTKAVAVTVEPNRFPDLVLGGDPGVSEEPGYWYRIPDWWDEANDINIWVPPQRNFGAGPGLWVYNKPVTPHNFWPGYFVLGSFSFYETGAHSNYLSGFSGLSRPAVGNLDGVGGAEVVVGAGPGSGGLVAVRSYSGQYSYWTKVINAGWASYNEANGETWPAVGNLNGTDYLLVGLGKGGLGYIQAFLWRSGEFVYGGELYLPDAHNYNATNGTTRPAIGDLTGDGNNEIAVGVDGYGEGIPTRVYIATLAADGWHYAPLEIPAVAGLEDARYNCETWPAIGDLDGDGKNELVINVTRTVDGVRQPVGFGVWTSALADGRLTFKLQAFKKAATFGLPALGDVFTPDDKAEIVLSQGPGSWTLSVFDVEVANGEWTILPEGTKASLHHDPFAAFGEVAP